MEYFKLIPTSENPTFHVILPGCGEILQVKREPLESDCRLPLGYTLVGVLLNTALRLHLAHMSL